MDLDDQLCLCFHVTKRKVVNYLRIERPQSVSQLSECHGAGTGCGWCRVFLERLFEASRQSDTAEVQLPDAGEYAKDRAGYIRRGGGTPPAGATPIDQPGPSA